jgi:hypothetical protein
MPEAYVECAELVEVLRKRRPAWIVEAPPAHAIETWELNYDDWQVGFWARAREAPARQAGYNDQLGRHRIALAKQQVAEARSDARQRLLIPVERISLDDPELNDVTVRLPDGEAISAKAWQVGAANHFSIELQGLLGEPQTFLDWLEPFVKLDRLSDASAWLGFWAELSPRETPTQWLAWAAGVLASYVKVNDGTVFDVQLCTYLSAADVLVTADRNLHRIANVMASFAPFPIATSVLTTPAGWAETARGLRSG